MSQRLAPRRIAAAVVSLALGVTLMSVAAMPASAADPCATGGNPIACENSKPGADPDEWDIQGAGDEGIQGFATDISVNVGGTIQFKIDTDARAYTIDIYRTGWYGGLGARKIASVTPSATLPQRQPQCVTDPTTEIYDCGNWAVSASWTVPSTAVSGVYIARLHDPATDEESHIIFVVRNDSSASAVLFQTSDPTWQAYNEYGGSNFYQGAANGRAYKISYNRPIVTRGGATSRDFYFSSEYAMVRFLERNGYDVSYTSGVDTDRRGSLIRNHKVFMSVGHDEYWSGAQRANVEAARDAGVNLAFFSGNEVYWRTRYENSIAGTSTPYRTLVSYKETWGNTKMDPSAEWTGTWRDPRFASTANGGGRPENGLTGTLYQSNFSDLPLTVTAAEGKLRLWRNTNLTSLAPGTSAQLAPHTVGYESDEDLDNGARPPGLIRLSTTTGAVPQYLLDYGNTVREGTTTHHLTAYRVASGALVFGAGTVQWAWGLDQEHDGDGAPADARMQQATINLLADMNALPTTLMSGMVASTPSTDRTGPSVTITSPAQGASISNGTSVTATGTAVDAGGGVVAGVEVSTDGGTTWHPATGTSSWTYTYIQPGTGSVPLLVRAIDDSANIGVAVSRPLTVSCPCSLYGNTVPDVPSATDAQGVELGLRFTPAQNGFVSGVRFYKGAANTGVHVGTLWSATGTALASVSFTGESATGWQTASFAQAVAVNAGTTYVVSYSAPSGGYAIENEAFAYGGRSQAPLSAAGGFGVPAAGVFGSVRQFPTSSFQASQYYVDVVYSTVDTTPLTASLAAPVAGASSIPTSTPVKVTFLKSVTGATVSLATQAGAPVAGTSTYDPATRTVSFAPSAALAPGTRFVVTATAPDLTGTRTWTFSTAAADQSPGASPMSFYNESAVPETLEQQDLALVTLGVRFTTSSPGTITGVRFYKGPNNSGTHVGTLWTYGSGTPLAQATFVDESTTGWQTVTFSQPVRITPGTSYVASYSAPVGRYSVTPAVFSAGALRRGALTADTGVFSYSNGTPTSGSWASYLVDVVFVPDPIPPVVVAQTPTANDPGAATGGPVTAVFNTTLKPSAALSLKVGSTPVSGTSSLSADAGTLTFTPTSALSVDTTYTVTASGLVSTTGASAADQVWSFTTVSASGCPCTLFSTQTPQTPSSTDGSGVELGVAFRPTQTGLVTGVRFYKGTGNGGSHVGSLWTSTGTRLATVTFANESAAGWQTAMFATPFEVTPGTTYVVSYFAPQGHYAVTMNDFTADRSVGPLTVPAVGNGRYSYGGGFPVNSWQQTNYFVDVVFRTAPPSPPTVTAQAPGSDTTDVPTRSTVSATLSKAPATGTPVIVLSGPSGPIAGTSTFDPSSLQVRFAPSAPLPTSATVSVVTSIDGTALANGSWTFGTAAATPEIEVSLWPDGVVPYSASWNDPSAVQVGTRFTPNVAGRVTAIRFYKGAANTGTHTVYLWGPNGALLAQAPSTGESASGWQTVRLPEAVTVVPGQTYVASYYTTSGMYAVTPGLLGSAVVSGPLSTVPSGGAYTYGTGAPTGASSSWYGVDLSFVASS